MEKIIYVCNGYQQGWENGEYIGRENKQLKLSASPLANSFPLRNSQDDRQRAKVINQYKLCLWQKIKNKDEAVINTTWQFYEEKRGKR